MRTWQKLKENPALWQRYFVKEKVIRAIREFFEAKDYHELESPIITGALPQERYINPLTTEITLHGKAPTTAYLTPTTETFNKKALAAGIGNHFVITKVLRGTEQVSPNHSPEFTMLEWYHLDGTYEDIMDDTEDLILHILKKLNKEETITYQGQKIHFGRELPDRNEGFDHKGRWPRRSVRALLKEHAGLELEEIIEVEKLRATAQKKGLVVSETDDWQTLFELVFFNEIEANLPKDQPVFIYGYPQIMCPLTATDPNDPLVCQKVELYIAGKELANGYTELRDPDEQERRFKVEQEARAELGLPPIAFDHDLVDAIRAGIPEVAGIGMGIDRLIMILADAKSISDINLFPAQEWLSE